jgi:hypothetical protein
MKSVLALFSNEKDADNAVSKIKDAGFNTDNTRVHTSETIKRQLGVQPAVGPAGAVSGTGSTQFGSETAGATPGAFLTDENIQSYLDKINVPADQQHFLAHGVREGGCLVHHKAENDDVEAVEQILADAGGRAPQAD